MLMLKAKRKGTWIAVTGALLILGVVVLSKTFGGVSSEVTKVTKGEMRQFIEDTAQAQSKEKQTVYIEGSGKVVEIHVDVGDTVKKGELLLSLDKADLELKLKDANAKVEASKAQLKGTESINYANKVEQAQAALEQARVSFDSAKRNYESSKNLYASSAISANELKTVMDELKAAQVAYDTANLQLDDVKKGAPDYVKTGYESQLAQADIYRDTILRSLQKQDVKADIDGVVLEKMVEENSLANPNSPVFIIGNIKNLELTTDILEDDISKVKIGNEVEISGKPIGEEVIKGEVVKIAPAAKNVASSLGVNQRRVPVTIKISGESKLLKPGYSLDIKIITEIRNDIVKVPDASVFDYQGQNRVFIVENGRAVLRAVKKGLESDNYIEITEGLKEGDIILLKPDNKISEGSKIKPLIVKK